MFYLAGASKWSSSLSPSYNFCVLEFRWILNVEVETAEDFD